MGQTRSGRDGLERRCRRLLLAYPRRYRRVRGEEMIGTLLDAATPGQQRPTWVQARDLLVGGVRERLRVPGSGVARFAAVWTALVLGWLTFGAGAWLGWQAAPALPSDRKAAAIAHTAFGDATFGEPTRWDFLFGFDPSMNNDPWLLALLGGDEYEAGKVEYQATVDAAGRSQSQVMKAAQARLSDAGWRIVDSGSAPWGYEFTAGNGRHLVTAQYEEDGKVRLSIVRDAPWAVPPLAVAGGALGALTGWLLVGWGSRRVRVGGVPGRRTVAAGIGYLGLLLTVLPMLSWLLWMVAWLSGGASWRIPFWFPTVFIGLRPMLLLAGCLGAVALLVAASGRRRPAPERTPPATA